MKFLFNRELSLLCLSFAGLVSFQVVLPSPCLAQLGGEPIAEAIEGEADAVIPPLVEGEKPPSLLIEIAEEPKTIDPATLVPAVVAQRVCRLRLQQPQHLQHRQPGAGDSAEGEGGDGEGREGY